MREFGWTIKEAYEQDYEDLCRLIIDSEKDKPEEEMITGEDVLKYF